MYIITSKTRSKMKRDPNSRKQISEERKHYFSNQGIEKIIPLKGQNEEETYESIKESGSFVKDSMQERNEVRRKEKEKQWKEGQQKRIKAAADRYFKGKEEKAKADQKKR